MMEEFCYGPAKPHNKKDRGFALTATALALALILISTGFVIASAAWHGSKIGLDSDLANMQTVRSVLRNAGAYASKTGNPDDAESYLNEFIQRSANEDLKRLMPGPDGTSYTTTLGAPDFSLYKTRSGLGGIGAVTVEGLPAGSYAIVADKHGNFELAGPAEAGMTLEIRVDQHLTEAYLVVYSPESASWRYPQTGVGLVNVSQSYTVSYSIPIINASAWTSPPGFAYLRVRNAPPLSLVLVEDSTGILRGAAWKSPADMAALDGVPELLVHVADSQFIGTLRVLGATAWVKADVSGGDVFRYTNNYG